MIPTSRMVKSRLPKTDEDGKMVIQDRPQQDYYNLHLNDEAFAALLIVLDGFRDRYWENNPTQFDEFLRAYPHYKSLFTIVAGLPYPQAARKAIFARELVEQMRETQNFVYLCPLCARRVTISRVNHSEYLTPTCMGTKIPEHPITEFKFEELIKLDPTMYTEQIIALLDTVEGAHTST